MKTKPTKANLELRRREPLARGIRRIAREQIDTACRVLKEEEDPCRAVHESRKSFKKIRAILQLVAPEFGRRRLQQEKGFFREAARSLAPLRDAEVRLITLNQLIQTSKLAPGEFAAVGKELKATVLRQARSAAGPRRRVVAILHKARSRINRWPLGELERKHLEKEIRRAYKKGRKALRVYEKQPGDETFHAWRKRVKEIWYHLRIVQNLLPRDIKKELAALDATGELAGNAHDLAVLRDTLAAHKAGVQNALLIGEIDARLPGIHKAAIECGAPLFTKKPREFPARL